MYILLYLNTHLMEEVPFYLVIEEEYALDDFHFKTT